VGLFEFVVKGKFNSNNIIKEIKVGIYTVNHLFLRLTVLIMIWIVFNISI